MSGQEMKGEEKWKRTEDEEDVECRGEGEGRREGRAKVLSNSVTAVAHSCELGLPRNSLTGPAGKMSLHRARSSHTQLNMYKTVHTDTHTFQTPQADKTGTRAQGRGPRAGGGHMQGKQQ